REGTRRAPGRGRASRTDTGSGCSERSNPLPAGGPAADGPPTAREAHCVRDARGRVRPMSALPNPLDATALGWVKPELDALLQQARAEMQAWEESPADAAALASCAQLLRQVRGSLQMLDLEATAALAEEMRLLALAIGEGAVADREHAAAALVRGLVQLPDYLERLQRS